VILAIDALQVTICKKNIADPISAADGWFFSPMDTDGGNVECVIAVTIASPSDVPVRVTISGAYHTIFKFFEWAFKGIEIQG
jgi:hypothetical protein